MERRCPDTLLVHTDRNGGFLALVRFLNTYYGKKELSQCWTAFKIPASNTPTSSLLFPTIYKMSLPTSFGFPNYKSWPNKRQIRIWAWQIVIILLRLLLSWKKPSTNNRYLLLSTKMLIEQKNGAEFYTLQYLCGIFVGPIIVEEKSLQNCKLYIV